MLREEGRLDRGERDCIAHLENFRVSVSQRLQEVCAGELVSGGSRYKWLVGERSGSCQRGWDGAHTLRSFSIFSGRDSQSLRPCVKKSSHKGKNASPFNLRNYRRQEDRVSSDKLGACLAGCPSYKYRPPRPGNTVVREVGSYWGASFLVQCPGVDCLHTSVHKCLEAARVGMVPEGGYSETTPFAPVDAFPSSGGPGSPLAGLQQRNL